ncbi:MAG: hypothetical protein Q9P01_17775 [Anaerolineae bacterium]|nr:hypothetical protein [Anaerolineae bacterium]
MSEKEQNNTMLYVVVFIGLIIIGVVKAVFGSLFSTAEVDLASVIVTEVIGAALMGGLFVYIIQRITAPAQRSTINLKFSVKSKHVSVMSKRKLSKQQEHILPLQMKWSSQQHRQN